MTRVKNHRNVELNKCSNTIRFAWVVSRGAVESNYIDFYNYSYKENAWSSEDKEAPGWRIIRLLSEMLAL